MVEITRLIKIALVFFIFGIAGEEKVGKFSWISTVATRLEAGVASNFRKVYLGVTQEILD